MKLPEGYTFFWDSQFKDQKEAVQAIVKYFPLAFLALVVILVALRQLPTAYYYSLCTSVVTHRSGCRNVVDRI